MCDWNFDPANIRVMPVDCFSCPNWTGTGCGLTACCLTKTYIYIDGKMVEI